MPFDVNLPPPVQCPPWCAGRCCSWQPDGDDSWVAVHESDDLSPPGSGVEIALSQVDEWFDDTLHRLPAVLIVDGQALPVELLRTALNMLTNENWVACSA